ncbi:glycosyltransferase family 4 protein [Candidatus Woesearchaeota archaeon]|nr:glycosyltransferase family 4 protein [Candidatus Woesearchaeota archaeon]
MHILLPFPYVREGAGGIANFVQQFGKHAAALGHTVTIVSTLRAGEAARETQGSITTLRFPMQESTFLRRLRDYERFGKLVRHKLASGELPKPDVILGVSYAALAGVGNPLVFRSASGPIEWELKMWETIWTDWIPSTWWKRLLVRCDFTLQKRLEARCVRAAKGMLCQSQTLIEGFRNVYGTTVPASIPCTGVDTLQFAPRKNLALRKKLVLKGPVLLFTGGFSIAKGGPVFERALPKLFDAHPDTTLVIVGSESYSLRLDAKYERNVLHLGHVPHDTVHHYFNIADVFVFPTVFNEGFPNVALEAMASGLPIIISRIPGIDEYVTHGKDAIVIPQFDSNALVNAVHRVLMDKKSRKTLGVNARKTALAMDWKNVVPGMIKFMQQLG